MPLDILLNKGMSIFPCTCSFNETNRETVILETVLKNTVFPVKSRKLFATPERSHNT